MGRKKDAAGAGDFPREQSVRDQEVSRANRELAAYFKGQRTEREARAALKIIKAYVRDRERQEPKRRAPLPGMASEPAAPKRPGQKRARRKPAPLAAVDQAPRTEAGE